MKKQIFKRTLVKLHPEASNISFLHKLTIYHAFKKSVLGTLGIHYFSLMSIDQTGTLTYYSTLPALEFNLIDNNFWTEDGLFQLENHQENTFVFWDEMYVGNFKSILIKEKERRFGFLFGFVYMKKIGDIFVIYSFATKESLNREDCKASKEIFAEIGDYFFAALQNTYHKYPVHHYLRLIVNNTVGEDHAKWAIKKDL